MDLNANCIYVTGDTATVRAFFEAAEVTGEFSLAPWMVDVDKKHEHPNAFEDPCVEHGSEENGGEWTASWDSKYTYFSSVKRTSEAWPALRFEYLVGCMEGSPWLARAAYKDGDCIFYDETEEPAEAREWHPWFAPFVEDWADRMQDDDEDENEDEYDGDEE